MQAIELLCISETTLEGGFRYLVRVLTTTECFTFTRKKPS